LKLSADELLPIVAAASSLPLVHRDQDGEKVFEYRMIIRTRDRNAAERLS
jgi:hypothetical protein